MSDSSEPIDDTLLREYLAERLPGEQMARVEKSLRDSAELRARLEDVRNDRQDVGLHSLGAIWRRGRLTCPSRSQLGAFLLESLEPDLTAYVKFHVEVVTCPFCLANLADLKLKAESPAEVVESRRERILESSRHLLASDVMPAPRTNRKP